MAFNQLKVRPLSKFWFQIDVNLHPYSAGAELPSSLAAPVVVYTPRPYVRGAVTFKWAARDPNLAAGAEGYEGAELTTIVQVQCPGGERVTGETCTPCAPGEYNDRNLPDQVACNSCPPGKAVQVDICLTLC